MQTYYPKIFINAVVGIKQLPNESLEKALKGCSSSFRCDCAAPSAQAWRFSESMAPTACPMFNYMPLKNFQCQVTPLPEKNLDAHMWENK